jgi:hypothetical protein
MDWVTIRLRYIRRDCGEWTRLWLVPLCLATSAWGDAGFYSVLVAAPLLTCWVHALAFPDPEPLDSPREF